MTDNAEQYDRLLAAYSIPGDDRAQWLSDMADLYDDEDPATLRAAVDQYRKDVKPAPHEFVRVPTPEAFSDWVQAIKDAGEREKRKALPAPATTAAAGGSTAAERAYWAKKDAVIGPLYLTAKREREEGKYLDERTDPVELGRLRSAFDAITRLYNQRFMDPETRRRCDPAPGPADAPPSERVAAAAQRVGAKRPPTVAPTPSWPGAVS